MSKLILMMGQPGSGKSTFLKNLKLDKTYKVISRDAIRFSLIQEDDEYFSKESEVFSTFTKDIELASYCNDYVFADATHLNRPSRRKLLSNICISLFSEIDILWIKTPLKVSLSRNEKRIGTRAYVPPYQIKKMFYNMTAPTIEEGFAHIYVYDFYTNEIEEM